MENVLVRAVTPDRHEARITVLGVPDEPGVAAEFFGRLADANIVVDMIIQNASWEARRTDITFTVSRADLGRARALVGGICDQYDGLGVRTDARITKLSVIGVGMRSHSGVAAKMFEMLSAHGINIQMISTSEIKISVVIDERYTELAVRALHEAFQLGGGPTS